MDEFCSMELGYFDGRFRVNFTKPFFSQDQIRFHALQYPVFIDGLLVALVFAMPKVKDFCRHEPVFSLNTQMREPQDKVRVFMAPALKRLIKPIDTGEIPLPHAEVAASDAAPLKALFYPE